jgi:hypothetical protein
MAKYLVTINTLWIAGQKYRRGDIVELENPSQYGAKLQLVPEQPEPPKRKYTRKKKVEHEDS